jgi:hypothetical protein
MPIAINEATEKHTYVIELSDIPDITGVDPQWKLDVGNRYTRPQWLVEKLDNILVWMGLSYRGKENPSSFFEMWGFQPSEADYPIVIQAYEIYEKSHATGGRIIKQTTQEFFRTGAINASG